MVRGNNVFYSSMLRPHVAHRSFNILFKREKNNRKAFQTDFILVKSMLVLQSHSILNVLFTGFINFNTNLPATCFMHWPLVIYIVPSKIPNIHSHNEL